MDLGQWQQDRDMWCIKLVTGSHRAVAQIPVSLRQGTLSVAFYGA